MLDACRLTASSSSIGKNRYAWRRNTSRVRPLPVAACAVVKARALIMMSGCADSVFGRAGGVVRVVLADPPAVAQADTEVAEQDAKDVVGRPGAEDLPVPGVVAKEADLSEHDGQERGHRELPP